LLQQSLKEKQAAEQTLRKNCKWPDQRRCRGGVGLPQAMVLNLDALEDAPAD
jgi:hypothetical protein